MRHINRDVRVIRSCQRHSGIADVNIKRSWGIPCGFLKRHRDAREPLLYDRNALSLYLRRRRC